MNTAVYEPLEASDVSWYCCACGLPNFDTSLFEDFELSMEHSRSGVRSRSSASSVASLDDCPELGPPKLSSSLKRQKQIPSLKSKLRVLVINFQSIKTKKVSFWSMLAYTNPDIIIATETWLKPSITEGEILPDGYRFVARRDRPENTHGGTAIIARSDMDATEIETLSQAEFIAASFSCKKMKKPLVIGCLYRPTDNNIEYTSELCRAVHDLCTKYKDHTIWIGGDANLPDINWTTDSITGNRYLSSINKAFIDVFNDTGCQQMIDFPTRLDNTLDIFSTNRPSLVNRCVSIPGLSDHDIVLVDTDIIPSRRKPPRRLIHLWKEANITDMERDLSTFSQEFVSQYSSSTPIDTLWDTFKHTCTKTISTHVPSKISSTRFSQPWANRNIRRIARRKHRAFRKARSSGKQRDWDRYRSIQKLNRAECRKAYNEHVTNIVSEDRTNKKLYTFIKSKKCDGSGVSPLKKDGHIYADPKEKAEILNQQFSSVFSHEGNSPLPDLGDSDTPTAPDLYIHPDGVLKLLKGLNPHKATGPDQIPSRFLKEMAVPLTPALTLIFQASLEQGCTPSDWKSAMVSPIYKKGDKSKPSNYRPISLTSICCKVMEHIVHSHIMKFFDSHNILSDSQHGFRKRRSCGSQLILTIQDMADGLNNKEHIDAILLDFSKAFDKVAHNRLVAKLNHYGIRGNLLHWIASFLASRSQRVVLDGESSCSVPVTSGVPQGTVMGPLLFLVYINDLPAKVKSSVRMFADDCLLYRNIHSQTDAELLQADLDSLQEWERDWLMDFNADKCEHIRITKKRKFIDASYYIHNQQLKTTNKAKYLGVTIDGSLTWNHHIDSITKKANITTSFLQRNLATCPPRVKETCYKSLVRPQLEYASNIWDPHTQSNIDKIEAVQRRAARFTTGDYRRDSSVSSMISDLGWESLQCRRQQTKAVMMFRVVHQLVEIPSGPPLHPVCARTRGHDCRFLVPYSRVNAFKYSFFPSGIRLWNSLPSRVIEAQSIDTFRSMVGEVLV